MRTHLPSLALLAGLPACSATFPGSGTDTLYVEATTEGKPDGTTLKVEVKRAGLRVEGANVYVEDVDGAVAARSLEAKGDDRYEAKFPGYVRGMRMKITAGEDELEAGLEGPLPHLITNPASGAIVLRDGEVLTVEWSADDTADRVQIKAEKLDEITIEGDPGEHALPLAGLEDGEQKVRVTRETSVSLAGGVEGSIWRARYEVDNRFTLKR